MDNPLLWIAIFNVFTGAMALIGVILSRQTLAVSQKTEINTNSMKDALIAATDKAAHATGKEEGRIQEVAKNALVATTQLAAIAAAKDEEARNKTLPS